MNQRCDLLCLSLPRAERLRRKRVDADTAGSAAGRAQALADPTRLTVAAVLAEAGELCVCDIAWICERSQNLISHHLRILRNAGLVASRRDKKMVIYALSPDGRALAAAVVGAGRVVR